MWYWKCSNIQSNMLLPSLHLLPTTQAGKARMEGLCHDCTPGLLHASLNPSPHLSLVAATVLQFST